MLTGRPLEVRFPGSFGSRSLLTRVLGHNVTVFGATGFLGRYIVHKLGRLLAGLGG